MAKCGYVDQAGPDFFWLKLGERLGGGCFFMKIVGEESP